MYHEYRWESPAGSTLALIFNFWNSSFGTPVNIFGKDCIGRFDKESSFMAEVGSFVSTLSFVTIHNGDKFMMKLQKNITMTSWTPNKVLHSTYQITIFIHGKGVRYITKLIAGVVASNFVTVFQINLQSELIFKVRVRLSVGFLKSKYICKLMIIFLLSYILPWKESIHH